MTTPPKKHRPSASWPIVVGVCAVALLLAGLLFWLPYRTNKVSTPFEFDWDLMSYRDGDEGTYTYYDFVLARQENRAASYPSLPFSATANFRIEAATVDAIFEWERSIGGTNLVLTIRFNQPIDLPAHLSKQVTPLGGEAPLMYRYQELRGTVIVTQVEPRTIMVEIVKTIGDDPSAPILTPRILNKAPTNVLPALVKETFQAVPGYSQTQVIPNPKSKDVPDLLVKVTAYRNDVNRDTEKYQRFIFSNTAAARAFHLTSKSDSPGEKVEYWLTDTTAHERIIYEQPR
jgi:hypothetical protein